MVTRNITILNPEGLHMRPAGIFAEEMGKFSSNVTIRFKNHIVNAKSLLSIMAACISCGSSIEIECSGNDEEDAMNTAVRLIESRFIV